MALPTLRPYYITSRRPQAERIIVRRRGHEADERRRWLENSRYFADSVIYTSKQEAWTSSQSFMNSMAAYNSRGKEEERKKKLEERRMKLASLLEEERELYEQEMKELSPDKILHMKDRAEQLKAQRIEQDKKVAKEKLHVHWRTNCPELRQVESRKMQRAVQEKWKDQIEMREKEIESARREKEKYDQAMEEERLAALKLEKELKARKKMDEQHYAKSLHEQMAEIKVRETEAAMLEEEHASLLKEQIELDKAEEERKKLEEKQKKAYIGCILVRQHKAQMRRKSKQIQESLELDLKILEDLALKEQEDLSVRSAQKEKAKTDAQWMRQVFAEQIEVEKRRERELDLLYQEEATRMWKRREEEWERERLARERLMNEVLNERQKQIEAKLESVKDQQAESIQRREELLRDMERANQMTAREAQLREQEKAHKTEELAQQVLEQKEQARRDSDIEKLELDRQRQLEEDYDECLREEEIKLNTQRYTPKFYGRRKYAWH